MMQIDQKYYANSQITEQDQDDRNSDLAISTTAAAGSYIAAKNLDKLSQTNVGQKFLQKRNYDYLNKTFLNSGATEGNIINQRGRFFARDFALEALRTAEETSPGKILRTFSFSHLLTPLATQNNFNYDFQGQQVKSQSKYLQGLITQQGDANFKWDPTTHERFGLRVQNGGLYEIDALGNSGKKLLDNVMMTSTSFSLARQNAPSLEYRNPLIAGYASSAGFYNEAIEKQLNQMTANKDISNVTIIGGKNAKVNWMQSYAKTTFMRGVEALGQPIAESSGWIPSLTARNIIGGFVKLAAGDVGKGVSTTQNLALPFDIKTLKNEIGNVSFDKKFFQQAATVMNNARRSTMIGTLGANIAKAAAIRYAGYQILDHLQTALVPEDQAFKLGITEGLATAAMQVHLGYASIIGDRLQGYKEEQERLFSGSTQIVTLAGLAAAPAMTSAIASYGQKVYETVRYGKEFVENQTARRHALFGIGLTSKIADRFGVSPGVMFAEESDGMTSRERAFRRLFSGRRLQINAVRSALPGLILALPFLPGALAGESSEELRKEYSGEKEVAVRANRWWGSGANSFEGDHIKYFKKNWYAELMQGSKTAQLYGDKETEREMNPFLNPLDYIRNPYQFEEMHQEDRPYAVWGMDVSFGNFFGKMFQETVGAILKPDIVNKNLENYLEPGQTLDDALQSGKFGFEETGLTDSEKQLMDDGLMQRAEAAEYNPTTSSLSWTSNALEDLVGLSGWLAGEIRGALGLRDESQNQLARSGQATNVANDIADMQLGGAFGTTESLRRFIPTNAWSREKGANPLRNSMPSWLPGSESGYYIDFQTGDPYSKLEKGFARLPGEGYGKLFKDVEGLNPEDYPEIYKFKILSDVAIGSKEYRESKRKIEAREQDGSLTEYEAGILATVREQQLARRNRKQFDEYLTDEQYNGEGVVTELAQKGWQRLLHNMESPLEDLTFFRPGGKMIHKRTAVEDYLKTQVQGSDTAMWTEYIDQFLKPALQRGVAFFNKEYVPEHTQERRGVDEYFDRLEYLKYQKLAAEAQSAGDTEKEKEYRKLSRTTITGANAQGYDDIQDVQSAYGALDRSDQDYFQQFINLTDHESRELLEAVLPHQLGMMYKGLWERRDAIQNALDSGNTMEEAMKTSSQEELNDLIENNQDAYKEYAQQKRSESFREFLAIKSSKSYIEDTTGMPDEDFIGWDPRIDINQVKLRTLTLGDEQIHEYGFWESDVEKLKRMIGILKDETVTRQIDQIKQKQLERKQIESDIADKLADQGYTVRGVEVRDSNAGDVTVNVTKRDEE